MDARAHAARLVAKHNTRDPFRIAQALGYIIVFAPTSLQKLSEIISPCCPPFFPMPSTWS